MKELKRTKVDEFDIENSLKLENLSIEKAEEKIITVEKIFEDKEKIELDDKKLQLFLNGVQLTYSLQDGVYRVYNKENFIGLGIINNKLLKRDIII